MHSLPLFVRLAGRPVILIGEGEVADAKRRVLERAGAVVEGNVEADAALAIVCLDGVLEGQKALERLKARGVLVNVVDRPELCDFTLPAIVDRDPVIIAVGTGGASAGLAKIVRQRIEALLPPTLGSLAKGLSTARAAMRARFPDAADRRRALDAALAPGGALDPIAGADEAAVEAWLAGAQAGMVGRLEVIELTSGDPDDLTLRAARLLGEADRVYHLPDVPPTILNRARADAVRSVAEGPPEGGEPGLNLWLKWRVDR